MQTKRDTSGIINFIESLHTKNNMSCDECSAKFSVFKRKKQCATCHGFYCRQCLLIRNEDYGANPILSKFVDKKYICHKCRILSTRPLNRSHLLQLRSKDLQLYLKSQKISTRGCVEKEDLVNLLMYQTGSSGVSQRYASASDLSDRTVPSSRYHSGSAENLGPWEYGCHTTSTHNSSSFQGGRNSSRDSSSSSSHTADNLQDNGFSGEVGVRNSEETFTTVERHSDSASTDVDQEATVMTCSGIKLDDIRTMEELENLTIKQIKELLQLNRVDYRGCVEKSELKERLARLWKDNYESRKEVENLSMGELCKICMDAPVECVMLECGHMATCMPCGKQLSECPICRQYVVRVVRTFKA